MKLNLNLMLKIRYTDIFYYNLLWFYTLNIGRLININW
jgi:hypothetical protein